MPTLAVPERKASDDCQDGERFEMPQPRAVTQQLARIADGLHHCISEIDTIRDEAESREEPPQISCRRTSIHRDSPTAERHQRPDDRPAPHNDQRMRIGSDIRPRN
jgi:hypothetical protein